MNKGDELARTNNACENFHRKLNQIMHEKK